MLQTFTLSNGIRVAIYSLPQLKSVHLRTIVKAGSIFESPKNNGIAHFMEHMLVSGIPSFPTSEALSAYVESLAGTYNAHTETLNVTFTITVPFTYLEDAVKIGSEVMFSPLFDSVALEKERKAVIEEIRQREDSPWHNMNQFLMDTRFYKRHALTLPIVGNIKAVEKITRGDIVSYYNKYFFPKNMFILVSGNVSQAEIKPLLEKYYGLFSSKQTAMAFPNMSATDFSKKQVVIRHDEKLGSNYIDLTFPSIAISNNIQLRLQQSIAMEILGLLRGSRLFKLLRYQKGLVYDVRSEAALLPEIGYGYVSSNVSSEKLEEVVRLIITELSTFVKNGPTEAELNMAKHFLTNQWLMAFDHPSSIADWIETELVWADKIRLPEEYTEMLGKISTTNVLETLQKHWDFKKVNLALQGSIKNTKTNKQKFSEIISQL
jgi:predicted Zn-dependent peptidase